MHSSRVLLLAGSTFALAACNPFHRDPAPTPAPAVEVSRDANANARWRASLVTPATLVGAVQINGSATMAPAKKREFTRLSLTLANATPGGVHPWEVRRGQCGADQGAFGTASAYKPIRVGSNGTASATVSMPVETPTYGDYFVTVQASAANPDRTIACGNLAPPAR